MPAEVIVKNQDRIQVLDVLRGFALAGILIINAMSILAVKGSTPAFTVDIPWADRILQDFILFYIESKFFTLSSRSYLELALPFKSKALKNREMHSCREFQDVWLGYYFLDCFTSCYFGMGISW